jgi:hypothetical protein
VFEKEKDRTQRKDFIFVSARVSGRLDQGAGGCWDPRMRKRGSMWCGSVILPGRDRLERAE